jgi:tripartite-type tricarboxylate transporter receptor subunit TctC
MFVPARTPRDIVGRLNAATAEVIRTPSMRTRFAEIGAEPMQMAPSEFDALIAQEVASNAALVKASRLMAN